MKIPDTKDIKGYEGLYSVSSDGRIWSEYTKKYLSPGCTRGYLVVSLSKDGTSKSFKVHRLVAEAFLPNYVEGLVVNHIDGNKQNNLVDNLEFVTQKENVRHSFSMGLSPRGFDTSRQRKLTQEDVTYIKNTYIPYSRTNGARAIARRLGVSHVTVLYVINNITYKETS